MIERKKEAEMERVMWKDRRKDKWKDKQRCKGKKQRVPEETEKEKTEKTSVRELQKCGGSGALSLASSPGQIPSLSLPAFHGGFFNPPVRLSRDGGLMTGHVWMGLLGT